MEEEAKFIIKEDKYTLSIIKNNKKPKKGISIFKKTLELNELNEDNINIVLENSKKDDIIYSYANLGFIFISGIICFAYCNEKDIKEIGIICLMKIYQVKNIRYIILQPDEGNMSKKKEVIKLLKEFTQYEVNRGLIFSQNLFNLDLSFDVFYHHFYAINKNICHINPNINFCYNYNYITYFRKLELEDFSTHLISGYFYHNIMKNHQKEELAVNLIIKDKEIQNENNKENENILREIEIILTPNDIIFDQFFHFAFYFFIGDFIRDEKIIYNLLKNEQTDSKEDNGSIIILDLQNKIKDKNDKEKNQILLDITKRVNENIDNYILLIIDDKNDIDSLLEKNKTIFEEINFNFEIKRPENIKNEFQQRTLLVISDNEINSLNIIESILYSMKYYYLDEHGEMFFKDEINEHIKIIIKSYRNYIKIRNNNFSKIKKIFSEPINEEFLNNNIFKNKKNEQEEEEIEKENISDSLEIDFGNMNNNILNKQDTFSKNININQIMEENNKILELKNIEESSNNLYLYIITHNVGNYAFENENNKEESLRKLLFPKEIEKYYNNNLPTFICIGLQEIVKLNTSNIIFASNKNSVNIWEIKITQFLQKNYNYTLQYKEDLVGILFLFFVKTSEAKNIREMKKSVIKAGFLNTLGNKGYILYEFKYKNKIFTFCTGHLTAGQTEKNFQDRVNLLIDMLNHKYDKNSNKVFQNDFYFLFGDLNFRVKIDKDKFFEDVDKIIKLNKKVYDDTFISKKTIIEEDLFGPYVNTQRAKGKKRCGSAEKKDRYNHLDCIEEEKSKNNNIKIIRNGNNENIEALSKTKISEEQFKYYFLNSFINNEELNDAKVVLEQYNISEHRIKFLPTYKYFKGFNFYNVSKRVPSWTDRILFKKSNDIKCLCYDKIDLKYSDHRPVYALFEIKNLNSKRKSIIE